MELILIVIIIVVIWIEGIRVQSSKRVPIANQLIEEKINALKSMEFNKLLGMIGKGYFHENIEKNGVKYYMGYLVQKPGIVTGMHSEKSKEVISGVASDEKIDEVEMVGYVDCITIIPIIYFKSGPSFRVVVNRNGEIIIPQQKN